MPRSCGPCTCETRNELDRRLLRMALSHKTYRGLSREFGYSEDALRRHRLRHLEVDLGEVMSTMHQARTDALQEVHQKELEQVKEVMANSTAGRLENAGSFLDQLREVRSRAANLLDQAEMAQDLRAAGTFLKELREQIRLMAELEAKLTPSPADNINEEAKTWLRKLFAFQYERMKSKLPDDEEDDVSADVPSEENMDKEDPQERQEESRQTRRSPEAC
jgi:hypothetical protein